MPPPTARLHLDEPTRKTALATVTAHAAGGFLLDRTVFHASDPGYHHAQPDDRGHVLADGHKLKIARVHWDRGLLVHRTTGPLPGIGAKAQLHLDAERRDLQARAHALMHLLVAALAAERCELLEPPRVVGGGEARVAFRPREPPSDAVPKLLAHARRLIDAREDVTARWRARDDAAREVTTHVLPLDAIAPGEPTLRLVQAGRASVLPCDAPLVARTSDVGAIRPALLQVGKHGVRWGVKVA